MIATSHVIVGGAVGVAVGTVTKNPAAALAAGIASHLICDFLPHTDSFIHVQTVEGRPDQIKWTKQIYVSAIADSLLAFLITLFVWHKNFQLYFFAPYAWGALGGYLPDLIDNFPLWSKQIQQLPFFKQFHELHAAIHRPWQTRWPMPKFQILGWLTQIIAVSISLWFLLH